MNLTFLNTLFLAGLAAVAIPIVIHLLQRRRLKRIDFSDLRFLAPLNQQRMRSMNMRRWLLLLLRVLIVAFTALAMARPSVRGGITNLVPTQARSSILLLVDTSFSMRSEGEEGTTLDAAKRAVTRLLEELQPGDEVNLMTFDREAKRWFQTPVHDFAVIRERVAALEASHAVTDWRTGIEAALEELAATIEPNRELYVISDFVGAVPESLRADLRELQDDMRITFVPVRVEPFVNVSVDGVQLPPGAVLRDDPVRIGVTVRNHAADAPADCVLRVDLGGEPKGEASLRLGRGALLTQDFTLVATQAHELQGNVFKRVDRLPADDEAHFVLPVLAKLGVLHLASGTDGGAFFLSRALDPSREGASPIALTEVEASRFSSSDLEAKQVVVVSSNAVLTDGQIQVLAGFVKEGGGLCMWTGRRETADSFNQLLSRLGAARVRGVVPREEGFLNLADLRPSGILSGFKPEELRLLERVQFTHYAELSAGPDVRSVLRFSGGEPALIEGAVGAGRYMVFAFDAGNDGSDLALSTMFLPLVHRTVVYLAGETGRQKLDYKVGERIEVQIPIAPQHEQAGARRHDVQDERYAQAGVSDGGARPVASDDGTFTVTTPSNRTEALVPRYVNKMAILTFDDTSEPGHYVFAGMGQTRVRAVNVDTRESVLSPFEPADLAAAMKLDVDELADQGSMRQHIREARHGKELYKFIVLLVLVLMVIEIMVSRVAGDRSTQSPA